MEESKDIQNEAINEEDLEEVAGGAASGLGDYKCWFTKEGSSKLVGEETWLKCKSLCGPASSCGCHGQSHCVDKWHLIDTDKTLLPRNHSNHRNKMPPSYNA